MERRSYNTLRARQREHYSSPTGVREVAMAAEEAIQRLNPQVGHDHPVDRIVILGLIVAANRPVDMGELGDMYAAVAKRLNIKTLREKVLRLVDSGYVLASGQRRGKRYVALPKAFGVSDANRK